MSENTKKKKPKESAANIAKLPEEYAYYKEMFEEYKTSLAICKVGIDVNSNKIYDLFTRANNHNRKIEMLIKCVKNLSTLMFSNLIIVAALIGLVIYKFYF